MREDGNGGEVVGHDHDGVRLAACGKVVADGTEDLAVNTLDGFDLSLKIPLVSALVGSLEMHEDEVASAVEQIARRLRFAREVGGKGARCALHVHALHTGAYGDAFEKVHGAHHASRKPVPLLEVFKGGTGALSPEPDAARGIFAG